MSCSHNYYSFCQGSPFLKCSVSIVFAQLALDPAPPLSNGHRGALFSDLIFSSGLWHCHNEQKMNKPLWLPPAPKKIKAKKIIINCLFGRKKVPQTIIGVLQENMSKDIITKYYGFISQTPTLIPDTKICLISLPAVCQSLHCGVYHNRMVTKIFKHF